MADSSATIKDLGHVMEESTYGQLLTKMDKTFPKKDVKKLKYLCYDLIEDKDILDKTKYAMNILTELNRTGFISNTNVLPLVELVHRIGQIAFKKQFFVPIGFDWNPERDKSNLDKYRVLLFDISQEMRNEDLKALKDHVMVTCDDISVQDLADKNTCYDIFIFLEENGVIADDDLDLFKNFCKDQVRSRKINEILRRYEGEAEFPMVLKFPQEEVGDRLPLLTPDALMSSFRNGKFDAPPGSMYVKVEDLEEAFKALSLKDNEKLRATKEAKEELIDENDDEDTSYINFDKMDNRMPVYKMDSFPRGLCVIIANENFKKLDQRHGNQHDIKALLCTFEKLQFQVELHENKTAEEMKVLLEEYRVFDHTNYDSFFLCVMSHGAQGSIFGVDEEHLKIQEITNYFNGTNCPTLLKKPKVFIIQACQGTEWMEGSMSRVDPCAATPPKKNTSLGTGMDEVIPTDTDMFLLLSTLPGKKSVRTKTGTWFIQTLVKAIDKFHHTLDFGGLIVFVNNFLSKTPESAIDEKTKQRVFQQVGPIYTLRKLLFLNSSYVLRRREEYQQCNSTE